ncbi:tyrosine-type recombinase/integrase [Streptomyces sp. TRM43335]|uniref:Tyrosine-type recombinase/integrase n=1 Tax=Streptomyces taklimakanensis TaxID=2569853 RepID=A0A6G2BDS4_9ACTN|nr:tyrosine-type recombinase/integrase [Streptomyces taklimakanensis]
MQRKVKELEKLRAQGSVPKPGKPPTVAQWLETWLDTVCARKVQDGTMAPRTLDDYRSKTTLYLVPGVGQHRIDRLAPEHLDALYLELLNRPLAASTVLKVHRIISRALKVAHQRGIVARNVATLVDAPSAAETEIEPLTQEQARAVLAEADRRRNGARWSVALAMGLRQGEALGLRWKYIDLDEGTIRVWWQLQRLTWRHGCDDPHKCGERLHRKPCPGKGRTHALHQRGECPKPCPPGCTGHAKSCPQRTGGGLVFREPKGRNKRVAPIPPPLIPLLRAQREAQAVERETAGELWQEHDLVFAQPNGRPVDPRADYDEWVEILEAAGVPSKRVHDGRHTAGTLLIEAGISPRVVMEILGHSQMRVTQRYTHVGSKLAEEAAARMGRALFG